MTQPDPLPSSENDGPISESAIDCDRDNARSNLFVLARISSDEVSGPVRIRNLSSTGALIEGAALPPEESAIRLTRARHTVSGRVIWSRNNRAGIGFDCTISVAEWLPSGTRATGQQRIDEIVHACKGGAAGKGAAKLPGDPDFAETMMEMSRSLSRSAETLLNDPLVFNRHSTAIQTVDVTAQKLSELAWKLAQGKIQR
jgi:hypothetical protein